MRMHCTYILPILIYLTACGSGSSDKPNPTKIDSLGPGSTCTNDSQCASGYCIPVYGLLQCAQTCQGSDDCPDGFICALGSPRTSSTTKICLLPNRELCTACNDDSECGGGDGHLCYNVDEETVCLSACDKEDSCPTGYNCQEIQVSGKSIKQCWPYADTCSCNANNHGTERICTNSITSIGTCQGVERCDSSVGWVDCNAKTPQEETCNSLDDDCDDLIDEESHNQPLYEVCGYGYEDDISSRPSECTGKRLCVNGDYIDCDLEMPLPGDYTCDNLDDDCDGYIDEDALGSNENCTSCGDQCSPELGNLDTVYSYGCISEYQGCVDPWECMWPFYDVDGLESTGCEIQDDIIYEFGNYYHTYTTGNARILHAIKANKDGVPCDSLASTEDCGEEHFCIARLPWDDRPTYFSDYVDIDSIEGVDFYLFWYESSFLASKEAELRVYFDAQEAYYAGSIEVCISTPIADYNGQPDPSAYIEFQSTHCRTVSLDSDDTLVILGRDDNECGTEACINTTDRYYYVKVSANKSTFSTPFAGSYHIQILEDSEKTENLIGTMSTPCE